MCWVATTSGQHSIVGDWGGTHPCSAVLLRPSHRIIPEMISEIECWLFGGQVLFLAKVWILLGQRICTISLGGIAFWRSDPYTYLGSSAARPILGWLDVA